ncbi:MAG: hypothetical protein ABFD49_08030 [Armatimonadota bacterium]|nr:hypothetical protein [bacterium]
MLKAVRKGFREAYDHLGYVVFASLAVSILTAIIFSLVALAARFMGGAMNVIGLILVIIAALVAYLGAVGVYYYVNKVVFREYPVMVDTMVGIRLLLKPALALFGVDLLIMAVLAADVAFFLTMFGRSHNLVFAGLVVLMGYAGVVWLMLLMYQLPLLAAQLSMESGTGVGVILRKSFLLTADNPGFTVGLFLVIIAFAVLCAIPVIGIAALFLGASAFLTTHALRELFVRYGIVEEEPEVVEDGWPKK